MACLCGLVMCSRNVGTQCSFSMWLVRWHRSIAARCVLPVCPANVSSQCVLSVCPLSVSSKRVLSVCPLSVSSQCVLSVCPLNVLSLNAPSVRPHSSFSHLIFPFSFSFFATTVLFYSLSPVCPPRLSLLLLSSLFPSFFPSTSIHTTTPLLLHPQ